LKLFIKVLELDYRDPKSQPFPHALCKALAHGVSKRSKTGVKEQPNYNKSGEQQVQNERASTLSHITTTAVNGKYV